MIQSNLFLVFLVIGFVVAILWELILFINNPIKNIIIKQIIEVPFAIVFVFLFFAMLINFNYGEFRMFLLVAYIFGFVIERKTLGKLFAKLNYWLYNKFIKVKNYLKQTKIGKRVLK